VRASADSLVLNGVRIGMRFAAPKSSCRSAGFSKDWAILAGEVGSGEVAFLWRAPPPGQRGFYGRWQLARVKEWTALTSGSYRVGPFALNGFQRRNLPPGMARASFLSLRCSALEVPSKQYACETLV